jgi:hypothetical protein
MIASLWTRVNHRTNHSIGEEMTPHVENRMKGRFKGEDEQFSSKMILAALKLSW